MPSLVWGFLFVFLIVIPATEAKAANPRKPGPCVTSSPGPGPFASLSLTNECNKCRTAVVAICGKTIEYDVPPYKSIATEICRTGNLRAEIVTDFACPADRDPPCPPAAK